MIYKDTTEVSGLSSHVSENRFSHTGALLHEGESLMSSLGMRSGVLALGAEAGLSSERDFRSGQAIRICKGFLEGAHGRFLARRNAHRVLLEVDLREKTVTVDVAVEDVEKME